MKAIRMTLAAGLLLCLTLDGLFLAVAGLRFSGHMTRETFYSLMTLSDYCMIGAILCAIVLVATKAKYIVELMS